MTNDQVERIERFLEGRMSPEEQTRFEQDLATDQKLSAAYHTYRAVEKYMFNPHQYAQEDDVKKNLTKLGNEFIITTNKTETQPPATAIPTGGRIRWTRMGRLAAVAALLAIVVTGAWYLVSNNKQTTPIATGPAVVPDSSANQRPIPDTALVLASPTDSAKMGVEKKGLKNQLPEQTGTAKNNLFAAYFKPDTVPTEKEELLKTAFDLYERKRYRDAATAFEDALLELSTRGEETGGPMTKQYAAYYQALSYLAANQDAKAIPLLQTLTGSASGLEQKASWYLALAYLKSNKAAQALPLLKRVAAQKGGPYSTDAARLLALPL